VSLFVACRHFNLERNSFKHSLFAHFYFLLLHSPISQICLSFALATENFDGENSPLSFPFYDERKASIRKIFISFNKERE
jgi:hypothetical protein